MITATRLARHSHWTWLLLGAVATGTVLYVTRLGPGAGGDSTSYLMGAENLLLGNGFSRYSGGYEIRPITGFPPFYSLVLAAAAKTGLELFAAARLLNAVLFGANVVLVCAMVHWLTGSVVAPLLAGLLCLTRPILLELHSWVMSEPLFIFLSLAGVCLLALYLRRFDLRFLMIAGVLAALASLTRYVGVALTAAGLLGIALLGVPAVRQRVRDGLIFTGLSVLPLFWWLARNRAEAGTSVNRELGYHPLEPEILRLFMAELSSWLVPHQLPLPTIVRAVLATAIAIGLLIALLLPLRRRWLRWNRTRFEILGPEGIKLAAVAWLLGVYCAGSLVLIWANSTLLDAATTAAAPARYLAPVFVPALILFTTIAAYVLKAFSVPRRSHLVVTGYALLLVGFYAYNSLPMVQDPLSRLGYTGRKYSWSDMVAVLDGISKDVPIVSNNPELIFILLGRPAYVRPIHFDPYRDQYREDYEAQFAQLEDELGNGGIFVFFDELEADDLAVIERMELQLLAQYPMAQIFGHPSGPTLIGS